MPAGSLTAVLGPSGCGKTTLLRLIAGFERADARHGRASAGAVARRRAARYLAPERRAIGYVPQEGALFPHLDVRRERRLRAAARASAAAGASTELLELVGLAPLAERLPHQLSGGQQQRVALARALAPPPAGAAARRAVLLARRRRCAPSVREEVHALLREQGVTTVLVTHDQEEALSLADSVAVLRDGQIVQQGAPAELYERPADERLARFLGAVNVLYASFLGETAQTLLGPLPLSAPAGRADGAGVVMLRPEQLEVRRSPARMPVGRIRRARRTPARGSPGMSSSAATTATTRCWRSAPARPRAASCCWPASPETRPCRRALVSRSGRAGA